MTHMSLLLAADTGSKGKVLMIYSLHMTKIYRIYHQDMQNLPNSRSSTLKRPFTTAAHSHAHMQGLC